MVPVLLAGELGRRPYHGEGTSPHCSCMCGVGAQVAGSNRALSV